MQEILKPLLESDMLTDDVKDSIELALMEAITARENAIRTEVETKAKKNFESAKIKFEETFNTLKESYKNKLDDAKIEIEMLESKLDEMEMKPFANLTESELETAEKKLVRDMHREFDATKEKYGSTFDLIQEANSDFISDLVEMLDDHEETILMLESRIDELESDLVESEYTTYNMDETISDAVDRTERRMRREADTRIEKLKENLVTSTEIFLEQELAEVKADKDAMMQESQGRELLESIKGLVKQYWDVDSEVAEELLEMKKTAEAKVEQYKDMLKREHIRLEESQAMVEKLKKKVIVESKGSVLADDRKQALEKLAENIGSDKLEEQIDSLMESVIDTFNSGFSRKDVTSAVKPRSQMLRESSTFSSGDVKKVDKTSDELTEMLEFAGIRR